MIGAVAPVVMPEAVHSEKRSKRALELNMTKTVLLVAPIVLQ
jgi:hypothetical protein